MSTEFTFYGSVGNVAKTVKGNQEATLHVFGQQKNLVEVVTEIQSLLDYLEKTNPTLIEMQGEVRKAIERNSSLQDPKAIESAIKNSTQLQARLKHVLTAVSLEALKVIFSPAGILIEAVKAWVE
ncbi:MAG: hypothetical protein AAFW84_13440 [Cyanobacteria bacterium J06635_15]